MVINDQSKLEAIHRAISELAAGNFSYRADISEEGTESDAVLLGLNMLAEELKVQIEENQRVTGELESTENALELVFHAMDEDLVLIDLTNDRFLAMNKHFEEKLQISEPGMNWAKASKMPFSEGMQLILKLIPDEAEMIRQMLSQAKKGQASECRVHPVIGKETRDMQVVLHPIQNDQSDALVLWVCKDLTFESITHKQLMNSEKNLKQAEKISHIGHWTFSTVTGQIDWSDELCNIFGIPPNSHPSFEQYMEYVHPEDRAMMGQVIQDCMESLEGYDVRHRIVTDDGQLKYLQCKGECRLNSDGELVMLIGTSLDVTDMHNAESRIRASEKRLEMALNASNTGIFEYRFETGFLYWDQIACTIFGYDGSHHGSHLEDLYRIVDSADLERVKASFENSELFQERNSFSDSFVVHVNGNKRHITTTAKVSRHENGLPSTLIGTVRDITLQVKRDKLIREMNHQLERSNRDLKLMNSQLEEITHVASHDMKAPLLNMTALLKLLKNEDVDADPEELVDKLEMSIGRMRETLEVISKVLEVQFGKSLPSENIEFAEITNHVLNQIENQIAESGAEITTDFTTLPVVWYPRFHLNSILLNLVTNAIKYTKPGEKPQITLKSGIESGKPFLEVSDKGLGIDMNRHGHKLFKLFKRFHDHVPGKGVGLHIVHSIVTSHGGTIEVESEKNRGTSFKMTLLDDKDRSAISAIG